MLCRFYQPHPLLQGIVSNIMIYTHQIDRGQPLPVNLFPAIPEHSLYFYPRDPLVVHNLEKGTTQTCEPSIIVGPQVERVNLSLGHDHLVIRVGFLPGGLHRLLHQPLHELVDYTLPSQDCLGGGIRDVNEKLHFATDFTEMKTAVESFLIRQLSKTKPEIHFDKAIQALLKAGGNLSIGYLASESCLSMRQFERKCKERMGLSPKLLSRIIRFSKAYRMREVDPSLSWTSIAHASGYFDQMHFIRDFKIFAGVTPSAVDKELAQTSGRLQAELQL